MMNKLPATKRTKKELTAQRRAKSLKLRNGENGVSVVKRKPPKPFDRQLEIVSGVSADAASQLIAQTGTGMGDDSLNVVIALMEGFEPQDAIEALLCSQMIQTHNTANKWLGMSSQEGISMESANIFMSRSTKLMSLYVSEVEALQKYRSKGRQKIIVQHVTIESGGQAVVGDVGGGSNE